MLILCSGGVLTLAISNNAKPTVAAINGPAVGVRLTMTLPATIRVAWEGAKVAVPSLEEV
jgi:enoyl-CoA hydratase/carnithine racemase